MSSSSCPTAPRRRTLLHYLSACCCLYLLAAIWWQHGHVAVSLSSLHQDYEGALKRQFFSSLSVNNNHNNNNVLPSRQLPNMQQLQRGMYNNNNYPHYRMMTQTRQRPKRHQAQHNHPQQNRGVFNLVYATNNRPHNLKQQQRQQRQQRRQAQQPPPLERMERPDKHYPLPSPTTSNKNQTSYFVLHVGPPKTATTTLQYGLEQQHLNGTLFSHDGVLYDFLDTPTGPWMNQVRKRQCHQKLRALRQQFPDSTVDDWRQALPCWQKMVHYLQQHIRHYNVRSWLYSNENFAIGSLLHERSEQQQLDWQALQQTLAAMNIHFIVVITYRRYGEWLYSCHRHVHKYTGRKPAWSLWPDDPKALAERKGMVLPFVETALAHVHDTGQSIFFPFEYVDQILQRLPNTIDVRILNLHDKDNNKNDRQKSPMTRLLCDVLGDDKIAPNACAASQAADVKDETTAMRLNSAAQEENDPQRPTISNYDRIIVDAYLAGKLPNVILTRREAGLWARQWHQNVLYQRELDLPLQCPETDKMEALWEIILQKEVEMSRILQNHVPARVLRQEFDNLVAYPRTCLVNTTVILQNTTWNALWDLLNDPATEPLQGYADF